MSLEGGPEYYPHPKIGARRAHKNDPLEMRVERARQAQAQREAAKARIQEAKDRKKAQREAAKARIQEAKDRKKAQREARLQEQGELQINTDKVKHPRGKAKGHSQIPTYHIPGLDLGADPQLGTTRRSHKENPHRHR